jgi:AcrR family transcriptional regulator
MHRRAEQVTQTRGRIVAAALEVFAERGPAGTTMAEVARVADVSKATVTNHFATPDLLLQAVVTELTTHIQFPDPSIFTGSTSVEDRLRALTAAMFDFYARTQRWYDLLGAELTENPVLARAQADVWRTLRALYAEALAGTSDQTLARATAGLVHPATLDALRSTGLSVEESTDVVADSLAHQANKRR